jgi:hypothetical protein
VFRQDINLLRTIAVLLGLAIQFSRSELRLQIQLSAPLLCFASALRSSYLHCLLRALQLLFFQPRFFFVFAVLAAAFTPSPVFRGGGPAIPWLSSAFNNLFAGLADFLNFGGSGHRLLFLKSHDFMNFRDTLFTGAPSNRSVRHAKDHESAAQGRGSISKDTVN